MNLNNQQIADLFETVADMLLLQGENIHRVMAYRRAAQSIADEGREVRALAAEGRLTEIDGVGKIIAEKLEELLSTGSLRFYEELAAKVPAGLVEVLRVNGVGPKKAMLFYEKLGVASVEMLAAAAREGKLRDLPGMGEKSEKKILEGVEALGRRTTRARLDTALITAERLLRPLLALPGALYGDIGGSIRRGRNTIGDIDLLIAGETAEPIMEAFVNHADVVRILGQGGTKSSVELRNGLHCDLRVVPPERYGTALVYFTGSQAHNIRLRELALARGLSLNEWAFTPTEEGAGAELLCATEEEVYAALGLPWIAPELREDRGEFELAREGKLPELIRAEDIISDLHMHTTWSDGALSVREMAWQARERGLQFIVITDHSHGLGIANGLDAARLAGQREEIDAVNAEFGPDFRVLQGIELEIRADGTLDLPDEVLATLDVVVASLHVGLRQERAQVTARLLNAIRNPHVDIIGHPRGQLLPDREPADLDMEAVFAAALESGTALEINANPRRLDLDDAHARIAMEMGIPLTIDCDAHSAADFDNLRYGVLTARRARVTAAAVVNTWPLAKFLAWLSG